MIVVGIWNILPINARETIMNFCFLFNVIGQKVLSEEALESLAKRHYETLCFLEMYFPPAFFDISTHFTTHLIKEIKLLGPVFHHQMYVYESNALNYCIEKIINIKFYTGPLLSCTMPVPVWTCAACSLVGVTCRIISFQSSRPSDSRGCLKVGEHYS
jgi:hypothetical protein